MDKDKKIQLANNKIKRLQEDLAEKEFLGDDGYDETEKQLQKAITKLEEIQAK